MNQIVKDVQNVETNPLLAKLNEYAVREGLTVDEIATRLGFSKVHLNALMKGKRDIRELPISGFQKISAMLGIKSTEAMLLAGSIGIDDLADRHIQ